MERLSMRKIRKVLRLKFDLDLPERQIAKSAQASRSTIAEYLRRFAEARIAWPLPSDLADATLEAKLFPPKPALPDALRPVPDWPLIHLEMRKKGVTLFLLWQEHKACHPEGFRYSWFCNHYRAWAGRLDAVMRQEHRAGEKCFVDYAGQTMPVTDRYTGEILQAQIFVGVMGASNYTYCDATWSQSLPDWIGSHVRMLNDFGAAPEILVPDNLKSGVARTCRYEPELNPSYLEFANHYGIAVVPARVRKPRDKAKVEGGVLIVERWILACLRNRLFFSLAELNAAIRELLARLNLRPFKKLPGCRQDLFRTLDVPAMRPLPAQAHAFAEWLFASALVLRRVVGKSTSQRGLPHRGGRAVVLGGRNRLVLTQSAGVAIVEHAGQRVLCGQPGAGTACVWSTRNFQYRSGLPVHQ